ncbi:FGGY family carbohydrate kinase [Lonepinella sp. BR2271]|uniref:FGGY family carbohydrate kinase n=1 Tax=Lonepinella sp. BR2271 TaxID=3434550 RepID=UPI003F6DDC87
MGIYVGVDCGTQSTKVILIDTNKSKILAEASSPHELISDTNGKREQQPQWWISAFIEAFKQAIKQAKIDPQEVLTISVSGQQHGLVVLDKKGLPLYPAKLWCDTETAVQMI